jgi:hypothetical protein
MNFTIAENTDVRTVQTLVDEARALGLRVVHKPDAPKSNVVSLEERRARNAFVSPLDAA